jgi:hypothetical protein
MLQKIILIEIECQHSMMHKNKQIVHFIMTEKELHVVDENIYKIVLMNVFFTQRTMNFLHIDSTTNFDLEWLCLSLSSLSPSTCKICITNHYSSSLFIDLNVYVCKKNFTQKLHCTNNLTRANWNKEFELSYDNGQVKLCWKTTRRSRDDTITKCGCSWLVPIH